MTEEEIKKQQFWRIGEWEFDVSSRCIRQQDKQHPLRPNEERLLRFFILCYFSAPEYDLKEIIDKAWDGKGSKASFYTSLKKLRDAFGGDREKYIASKPFRLNVEPRPVVQRGRSPHRSRKRPSNKSGRQAKDSDRLTAVERIAEDELLRYPGGHVSAIRLWGSADRYMRGEELKVHYSHNVYKIPPELQSDADARITELREKAERDGTVFFNGPNVRLQHFRPSPPEQGAGAAVERYEMSFFLEPIGWFDYEGTNGFVREKLHLDAPEPYEYWIGLSKIVTDFSVGQSKLSNIFGNAITIFTADGKVGYHVRRNLQSSVPGQLSSSVAENTNRALDETNRDDPRRLVNSFPYGMKLSDGPDNRYCPVKGVPHPFAAVRRGLNEEASRRTTKFVPKRGIKFTGLSFGLDSLHADALWIVMVNLTAEAFKKECRTHPGIDWQEGRIHFVPANFYNDKTRNVLKRSDWVPNGKASLVRAIELIQTIKTKEKTSVKKVFDILARA